MLELNAAHSEQFHYATLTELCYTVEPFMRIRRRDQNGFKLFMRFAPWQPYPEQDQLANPRLSR